MARIFIDGFESGGYDLYDSSHANVAVVSTAGLDMDGSYCLDLTADSSFVQKTIAADDEIYVAFQWRPTAPTTHQPIFLLYSGVTYLAALFRNNVDNNLDAYRGTNVIDSGSKVIANATTYLVEIYFKLADAGGRFVVKVDGVTDIDFTGDTKNDGNATFDGLRLGYYTSSYYAKAYFDSFIVDDSAWIGETFIQGLVPTGIGNTSGWTPSAGDNYACVDEIPKNDADYVESNAADVLDTYLTGNMSGGGDIGCVQVQTRSQVSAGVSKDIKLVTRVNATDYLSAGKAVTAGTIKGFFNLWENNPDDAAAWAKADVDGMEIGVKSGATANTLQSYQTLVQVEYAGAVSLDPNNVECLTEVTSAKFVEELFPDNIECLSQVTAPTITKALVASNAECLTQVTVPSFTVKRQFSIPNIECLTQVTAAELSTKWVNGEDIPCNTEITVPSFTVKREITIPNVESSSEVGIPDFVKITPLNASDVSSLTEVTAAGIYKELFPSDVESSSEVEAADLEWIKILKLNATLPMITAEISGGHGGFLNVELPMITAEMRGGAQLNVTLPMITAELSGKVGIKADLNVTLPMIKAEMTGTVEVLGQLNVTLPMIQARLTGTTGQVGQLNVTLPMITAEMAGYTDIDGQLNVTLPMIKVYLTGTVERESCEILRYEEPELE